MFVILGCGSVGTRVAKIITDRGRELIIFDNDASKVKALRDQGYNAVEADFTTLDPAGHDFSQATAALFLSANDEVNLEGIKNLREHWHDLFIFVRAKDQIIGRQMEEVDNVLVIQETEVMRSSILAELNNFETKHASNSLHNVLEKAPGKIGIFCHNNPDPDCIASAFCFSYICDQLKLEHEIYYGGEVSHQENKAMMNLLNIEMTKIKDTNDVMDILDSLELTIMVDHAVPGQNNMMPVDTVPSIIIDHHSYGEDELKKGIFADINPTVGSTSTLMTKYVQQLVGTISEDVATALLYGIRTDTANFTRNTTPEDMKAVAFLSSQADQNLITQFYTPPRTQQTLDIFGRAIANRLVLRSYLVSCVGFITEKDALPQCSDFMLSLEGISTAVVFGIVDNTIHISSRSTDPRNHLGNILKKAFGEKTGAGAGGHSNMAGAQIPLGPLGEDEDRETVLNLAWKMVMRDFLKAIDIDPDEIDEIVANLGKPPSEMYAAPTTVPITRSEHQGQVYQRPPTQPSQQQMAPMSPPATVQNPAGIATQVAPPPSGPVPPPPLPANFQGPPQAQALPPPGRGPGYFPQRPMTVAPDSSRQGKGRAGKRKKKD